MISYLKSSPYFLFFILFILHFLSGYPGGMTSDSIDQFNQSLSFNYNSHHPPLMAMLWSMLNYIYPGAQIFLFLHLLLLWGGVVLLYYSDPTNKYKWLYLLIPFIPNVLSQSTMIWKDISFANSVFFIFSVYIYYSYKKLRPPFIIPIILSLIGFYALAAKFQAKFIMPIIFYLIVSLSTKKGFHIKIIYTLFLFILALGMDRALINKYSFNTNSWQLREFFDVAGIITNINTDAALPVYIKNFKGYDFNRLKNNFTHKWVDPLFFPEDRVFIMTEDPEELKQLDNTFKALVLAHPLYYLKHRFINFSYLMKAFYSAKRYGVIEGLDEIKDKGYIPHQFNNILKNIIILYLKIWPNFLRANLISLLIVFIYGISILKNLNEDNFERKILTYTFFIGIIFSGTNFLTSLAADYRYYYLMRVLTFGVIPIYLNYLKKLKHNEQ